MSSKIKINFKQFTIGTTDEASKVLHGFQAQVLLPSSETVEQYQFTMIHVLNDEEEKVLDDLMVKIGDRIKREFLASFQ